VTRQKGNKDYSTREKQIMISFIEDYSLFGATDNEVTKVVCQLEKEENEIL
jgi:hypothetical protein